MVPILASSGYTALKIYSIPSQIYEPSIGISFAKVACERRKTASDRQYVNLYIDAGNSLVFVF